MIMAIWEQEHPATYLALSQFYHSGYLLDSLQMQLMFGATGLGQKAFGKDSKQFPQPKEQQQLGALGHPP